MPPQAVSTNPFSLYVFQHLGLDPDRLLLLLDQGFDRIGPFALVVQQGELALRTREHPSPMRVGSSMLTLCTPGKRWLILLGAGPLRMPAPDWSAIQSQTD